MSPMLTNLFGAMILILFVVGLDLLLGGKGLMGVSRLFNQKVNVDNAVLKGLADLRAQGEKEVMRIDENSLRPSIRIVLAALLLIPAAMLFFTIFLRK